MQAPTEWTLQLKGKMGDIVFEPGQFTSKWSWAADLGAEIGQYSTGNSQRFMQERATEFPTRNIRLDFPLRFQVGTGCTSWLRYRVRSARVPPR